MYSLTWIEDILFNAGLKVAPVEGWQERGRADAGKTLGVLCHHTAGPRTGNMPSLNTLIQGRSDLPGPLAQLGLGRDGTYYLIAAGRCNHAGTGTWQGISAGNTHFIGIEAEHSGASDEPWPDVQMEAYVRGVAAILQHIEKGSEFCAGHKEYALPKGRKPDPNFDMNAFRSRVADYLDGSASPPALIPDAEPSGADPRPTLRRSDNSKLVKFLQERLKHTPADGRFGAATEAAVRQFQRDKNLVPDGIVGPKTWVEIDKAP